jgi:hypothetical protein
VHAAPAFWAPLVGIGIARIPAAWPAEAAGGNDRGVAVDVDADLVNRDFRYGYFHVVDVPLPVPDLAGLPVEVGE